MKILRKSLKLIILLLVIFNIKNVNALEPTNQFYVNDYANILSNETEKNIMKYSVSLEEKTAAQIVVATVKSLEGESVEEYANKLFRTWRIGDKEKNNGVLILISVEDRKIKIEVGYGIIKIVYSFIPIIFL